MQGSCNCGDVCFTAGNTITAVVNCHCKLCRKMNGSAFSTYVVVPEEGFNLTQGELKSVKVSVIYNQNPKLAGLKILYLGSIDKKIPIKPEVNIYCESQENWVLQLASLKSYEQGIV